MAVTVSALIRAREELEGIGALLDRLRAQTVPVEPVVNSGSTDGTLAAVRSRGIELLLYGYSNAAGAFRRELWRRRPFDESLASSEDKEWAWHWLSQGYLERLNPALAVHHSHADEDPLRTFRRARGDLAATRAFRPVPRVRAREALREWWRGPHAHASVLRVRLDPRRAAMLAGKWAALR